MLSRKATTERYNVTESDATKLLAEVENQFCMDWSEMSWAQIDKRIKATAKILNIKIAIKKAK